MVSLRFLFFSQPKKRLENFGFYTNGFQLSVFRCQILDESTGERFKNAPIHQEMSRFMAHAAYDSLDDWQLRIDNGHYPSRRRR
jgi:hypothetical protein